MQDSLKKVIIKLFENRVRQAEEELHAIEDAINHEEAERNLSKSSSNSC